MARIDHTGHNHPATPAGRAACRAGLAPSCTCGDGPGTIRIHSHTCPMKAIAVAAARAEADRIEALPPVAPVITFKRVSGELVNVLADGVVIGDIRKVTHEIDRPIPGTMLRYAKGRMVTKYFVSIEGSSRDTFGCDRLTDAQTDAQNRFWVINRLRREGYIGN